ncbi:MAG: DUF4838 domain-containing protein [Planctomycetia bacterium]|nr:DUF4838 domain-containing protein [Planctomycetia bacterium]
MKHFLTLAFVLLSAVPLAVADDGPVLARDGKSDYVITLPDEPSAVETTAANELQSHLEQVTGAKLDILPESKVPAERKQIVVGACKRLAQLVPDVKLDSLGYDGIVVKTAGDNLVLAGHGKRGALYAVYTFLEDNAGCRWWTSTESFVPKKPTLAVGKLDVVYAPKIRIREAYYRDAFNGVFAARSKCNGNSPGVAPEYGGHERFAMFVHTFFPLLPPEKYFGQHPEWYSEIDGKRKHEQTQLCLSDDEMRKELTRNALTVLRNDPGAGVISISQNDWHGRCQCAKCRAVEEEEGAPSGLLLRFVNAVAEDIEKEFPDVLVETLAYQYTRTPPKLVKPRQNVVVRLCSIECSFVQPLATGPQNEKFRNDIEGWSKIAPRLYVWDYVTNFSNYILPHANLRVLAPNLRFFVDHNVMAMFEQGDAGCGVGDFVRLRAWLISHLMWNPNRDEKALVREFLEGYYGPAAPHLEAYLNRINDAGERSGVYLSCFMNDTSGWLTLDDLNEAVRLFEKAQAAVAGDPVLASRVRRERMPLDHVWLQRYPALRREAKQSGKEFLGPKDPAAAAAEYIKLAHEFDAGHYREGQPFSTEEENLKRRFRAPGPPPEEAKGLSADDWTDFQDNEFNLAEPGKLASIVDDPTASDGKTARMPGDHYEWAVSQPISNDLEAGGPWRCYVVARVEATAKDGPAMTIGIYDSRDKRDVTQRAVSVAESAGGYHVFDLGTHALRGDMYFWVAPPKRPGDVTAVYVDRIFMVREKAKPAGK